MLTSFTRALLLCLSCVAVTADVSAGERQLSYNPFCASVPRAAWLSYVEVEQRLKELGFTLVRLRMADDRCYAVLVRDPSGRKLDLIVHPVTADIVKTGG